MWNCTMAKLEQSAWIAYAWQHEQRHATELKRLCASTWAGMGAGRAHRVPLHWPELRPVRRRMHRLQVGQTLAAAGSSAAMGPSGDKAGSAPMCIVASSTHLMQRRRLLPPQMHWSRLSSWPQRRPAVRKSNRISPMNASTASQAACLADTVVHHMLQIIAAPPVQTRGSCRQMRQPGLWLQAEVL